MSDTPLDDAQATTVLEAAEAAIGYNDHQRAYDLLLPVHESGAVQGASLGRTSLRLGEACLGLGAPDAAMWYFEAAVQDATGEYLTQARARVSEMGRVDAAVDAEADGVADQTEADAVLNAADDARNRSDFATAWQYYSTAYEGVHMTPAQVSRAAIGIAACHVQAGEAQEAEGYLQVAESADPSAFKDQIEGIRTTIREIATAESALADGVDRTELDELNRAAMNAAFSLDWDTAHGYFMQMYETDLLPGTDRGRVALNLGLCSLFRHEYDAAHQFLTEAASTGKSSVVEKANRLLGKLAGIDQAEDIVAELGSDGEITDE
jgi:tetratricopeptide (TPR) repeat protein